jgi:hypothetical protein
MSGCRALGVDANFSDARVNQLVAADSLGRQVDPAT